MHVVRKFRASTPGRVLGISVMAFFGVAALAFAAAKFDQVKPGNFDPAKTKLVNAGWVEGAGCPTNARQDLDFDGNAETTYTDPACPTGDAKDKKNEGLLLVKTGPTGNFAASGAELKNVKGLTLTELGYDVRHGSQCGGGAPRFNVQTSTTFAFIGCGSADTTSAGQGFDRKRWTTGLPGGTVEYIQIIFDEGTDTGTGEAIIDNVDVNGTLVGQGEHLHD
jgi:hypothetical protein